MMIAVTVVGSTSTGVHCSTRYAFKRIDAARSVIEFVYATFHRSGTPLNEGLGRDPCTLRPVRIGFETLKQKWAFWCKGSLVVGRGRPS